MKTATGSLTHSQRELIQRRSWLESNALHPTFFMRGDIHVIYYEDDNGSSARANYCSYEHPNLSYAGFLA